MCARVPLISYGLSPWVGDEGPKPEGVAVDENLEGEDAREEDVEKPQSLQRGGGSWGYVGKVGGFRRS